MEFRWPARLEIKLLEKKRGIPKKERNEQWKAMAGEAAEEIKENRKPFENAISAKWEKLHLLDN